jgi:hypothetical protein
VSPLPNVRIRSMRSQAAQPPWEAWNAEQIDVTGTIWEDRDPYTQDVSYYGHINRGLIPHPLSAARTEATSTPKLLTVAGGAIG